MAVRIQLSSNFQVVELTYNSWEEANLYEVEEATELVNRLGSEVVNEIKTKKTEPTVTTEEKKPNAELASEKQIKYAVQLGCDESKAKQMTKTEIWSFIQRNKK